MKDNYDFSKSTKNPFADRLRTGYSVNPFVIIEDDPIPLSQNPFDSLYPEAVDEPAKTK